MRLNARFNYDFFISRRGSVSTVATEVADLLIAHQYSVFVQDYDILPSANFAEAMHEAIQTARDLMVLWTADYEELPYTRRELMSFYATSADDPERRIVILRCEDAQPPGLLAPIVYQDLVGVGDPDERRQRILAAARGSTHTAPLPRPFHGVPPRVRTFIGRQDELHSLDGILAASGRPAAVIQTGVGMAALRGLGGVGKTSVAIEYAYRYRPLYAGVWWCPAETREGLLQTLAELGIVLGVDETDLERAARAALDRLAVSRAPWLLVYDNATDPEAIASLLPRAGARVLITSRFPDWTAWAEEVPLDVLPREEAVLLLQTRAVRSDVAGATSLANTLGYLPLALDHAAAYCRSTGISFTDYASQATALMAAVPGGTPYPRSVAATFDLAIAQAVQRCPQAEALMAFLAFGAPEPMPMIVVEGALADAGLRNAALAALSDVSLLRHEAFGDGAIPSVIVHRVTQTVGRARAQANGSAKHAVKRLAARLRAIYPSKYSNDPGFWPLSQQLTPHVLMLYSEFYSSGWLSSWVKRISDLAICTVLIFLALPVMLLIALVIRIDSSGPVFYRQHRVGLRGKMFWLLKFRTMFAT